ncbi:MULTISPECIES: hypothetical protein [unclassified Streptomyces]
MHLTTQTECGILIGASDQFARVSPDGSKVAWSSSTAWSAA